MAHIRTDNAYIKFGELEMGIGSPEPDQPYIRIVRNPIYFTGNRKIEVKITDEDGTVYEADFLPDTQYTPSEDKAGVAPANPGLPPTPEP